MDAQAIVNTIGSLLMSSEDDRITGKNQSLYAEPLDKVFTPYRKEWLKNWFERFTLEHQGMANHPFAEYEDVLREAVERFKRIFKIVMDTPQRIKAEMHVLADGDTPNRVGYVQWNQVYQVILEATPSGNGRVSLGFEGGVYGGSLTPQEFRELLVSMSTLPLGCEKAIIRRHYIEFLPSFLKKLYKTVTITENMGRSCHGGGKFTYGHEVVLSMDREHDFRYAFVAEYLWQKVNYNTIHDFARAAYEGMKDIARFLPEFTIITDHADDCGTHLLGTFKSKEAQLMTKITKWDDKVSLKTVEEVMDYYKIDREMFSSQVILNDYLREKKRRDIKRKEIATNLQVKKNGWFLEDNWDELRLYISGPKQWLRELYVAIPFDTPKESYRKILDAKDLLNDLYRQLDSLGDYFTSAGVFPKRHDK